MTATIMGRWQTRLFAVLVVGLLWTIIITPFLPFGVPPAGDGRLGTLYRLTLIGLGLTAGLGLIIWEPLYHLLQQFRWEKDWPPIFFVLQVLPEGLGVHWVLGRVITNTGLSWPAFILYFVTTWLVVFLTVHGPMRVPFLRWRFRGGRIL